MPLDWAKMKKSFFSDHQERKLACAPLAIDHHNYAAIQVREDQE